MKGVGSLLPEPVQSVVSFCTAIERNRHSSSTFTFFAPANTFMVFLLICFRLFSDVAIVLNSSEFSCLKVQPSCCTFMVFLFLLLFKCQIFRTKPTLALGGAQEIFISVPEYTLNTHALVVMVPFIYCISQKMESVDRQFLYKGGQCEELNDSYRVCLSTGFPFFF